LIHDSLAPGVSVIEVIESRGASFPAGARALPTALAGGATTGAATWGSSELTGVGVTFEGALRGAFGGVFGSALGGVFGGDCGRTAWSGEAGVAGTSCLTGWGPCGDPCSGVTLVGCGCGCAGRGRGRGAFGKGRGLGREGGVA
jgi:hypothetical protein